MKTTSPAPFASHAVKIGGQLRGHFSAALRPVERSAEFCNSLVAKIGFAMLEMRRGSRYNSKGGGSTQSHRRIRIQSLLAYKRS
uniref:Uncharacterized protein n=1 Tax=Physcomitrium patens TaxID=3218 RepID=A0A2K1KI47_PHYPA|nr:hypothetical protein PHYPA_007104 [Physcomitrium patens]